MQNPKRRRFENLLRLRQLFMKEKNKTILRENNPTVSVVIPCFNLGKYINEAVDSVLRQTYRDFEIIVVNDGSDDKETISVINKISNPKITVLNTENQGLASARNNGIKIARGRYIVALDADDMIAPTYLEKAVDVFTDRKDIGFVTPWVKWFGEMESVYQTKELDLKNCFNENSTAVASVFRKKAWEEVNGYDPHMPYCGYEDWDFWISISKKGWKNHVIKEALFFYRKRKGSMLSESDKRRSKILSYMLDKHNDIFDKHAKDYFIKKDELLCTYYGISVKVTEERDNTARERDEINREKDNIVREKDIAIAESERNLKDVRETLMNITSTRGWRMLNRLQAVADKYAIPAGSFRRKIVAGAFDSLFGLNKKIRSENKSEADKDGTKNVPHARRKKEKIKLPGYLKLEESGKKKILVIPSWYPTKEAPLVGSFFREQSALMLPAWDVIVLHGQPKEIDASVEFFGGNAMAPPDTISFYYTSGSARAEKENFGSMLDAYESIVVEMLKRGWKPDVIHAHCTVFGGIVANYLGKKFDAPAMITENQMFLLHNHSKFIQDKIFEALEGAKKVAAASTDKMKFILMHGIKCDPVVVGNLADDELFRIADKNKNSDLFEILIVAGASYIKDLPTFFRAVKEMINQGHTGIRATILGNDMWGGESYAELVKKISIEKYCNFVNSVERSKMPEYYHNSDVLVSSSIAEGFQVSIIEAMACGKPVVSTNHGGVEDNLTPENGILVNIRDYKAMADALIKIKNHEITFNPERIRQTVVEKYGKKAFKEKIGDMYEELIREK